MPSKKAAAAAPTRKTGREVASREPTTNGLKKSSTTATTTKKVATKAASATAAAPVKAATKKAPAAKAATTKTTSKATTAATKSKKRKADESEDEEAQPVPQVNGVKRAKKDKTPAPEEAAEVVNVSAETAEKSQRTTAIPAPAATTISAPTVKKPRTAGAINNPPTNLLNVYVFGDGTNGELGLGVGKNCAEVKRPRLNPHLSADSVAVVQVSVGGMHTAVLTKDNKVLTWGVNDQGALGRDTKWDGGLRDMNDDDSDSDSDTGSGLNPRESTPTEIDLSGVPANTVFVQLACTDSATFALTDDGLVYGCGTFRSNEGIFGFSPKVFIQPTLTLVEGLKRITKLAAGANHVLALEKSGAVFAWGSGQQNQLGRRILERFLKNSLVPTQFGLPKKMVNIGAGSYHSFAMHKDGRLYSWGLNSFGETGQTKNFEAEGESDVHHPTPVPNLESFGTVTQVEGGSHHTIAVTDKQEVLVWGRLDGFQLGLKISEIADDRVIKDSHNNPRILKLPTQVPGIKGHAVAAGSDHSIAIDVDGKAYAWGFSTSYQTGLGTDEEVEVATQIDNTAIRGKKIVWAGAGGQFSVIAGLAGVETAVNGVNGHA